VVCTRNLPETAEPFFPKNRYWACDSRNLPFLDGH
jgi:hypothetical protein